MEDKNSVSLWLGNIKNQTELEDYIDCTYTEEGDFICSKFCSDFKIDSYEIDEDFIERYVLEKGSNSINELLEGCSYYENIIPKFKKYIGTNKFYNTVVLIYNFKYENSIKHSNKFDYIGCVSYEE